MTYVMKMQYKRIKCLVRDAKISKFALFKHVPFKSWTAKNYKILRSNKVVYLDHDNYINLF